MKNEDFADVVDWVAVRMAFDECHDTAAIAYNISEEIDKDVIEVGANIEFNLISVQPPDDASDLLSGLGVWTFTWVGRVSSSHPGKTAAALKMIVAIGEIARAKVDIHVFDNEHDDFGVDFPDSPMMAIEAAMAGTPSSDVW